MRRFVVCPLLMVVMCCGFVAGAVYANQPVMLPQPKSMQVQHGQLELPATARIVATDPDLVRLGDVVAEEIYRLSGRRLPVIQGTGNRGDIVLRFDRSLERDEEYRLTVTDRIDCRGGTYVAVAWATSALSQLMQFDNQGQGITVPRVNVHDYPDIAFRSAMCDIARKWHPIENLYELIDLFRFYRIRYIQLHLNDHGLFTFGSEKFPKLPSMRGDQRRHYTLDELRDLVAYADARGVGIIGEMEMPGHTDKPRLMPEVFGAIDRETGEASRTGYINVNRDDTVQACAELLNEVMDVFDTVPYVSIGADEVVPRRFENYPNYDEFVKNHPDESPFDFFLKQMSDVAQARDRRLMVYGRRGPHEILQMPWSGNHPQLARDGYDLIMHSAGSVTQHLVTGHPPPYNSILLYTSFTEDEYLMNWRADPRIAERLYGIHILTWQHWHFNHFPDLRKTMAVISENAWNQNGLDEFLPFEQWKSQVWSVTDARLEDIAFPVRFTARGLLNPKDIVFHDNMTVELHSDRAGTIHYRKEPMDYRHPPAMPTTDDPVYSEPIVITEPTVIYAALFDADGNRIGWGTQRHYWPINPVLECTVYHWPGDSAARQQDESADTAQTTAASDTGPQHLPNPKALGWKPVDTFPMGRVSFNPRHENVYFRNYYLVMRGQIRIENAGDYRFIVRPDVEMLINGKSLWQQGQDVDDIEPLTLDQGTHDITIYARTGIRDRRTIQYVGAGMSRPRLLDELLMTLPAYR